MDLLVFVKNMYVFFLLLLSFHKNYLYYRLTMIGGNGYIGATLSVTLEGILRDGGGILSVLPPFLAMKGVLR